MPLSLNVAYRMPDDVALTMGSIACGECEKKTKPYAYFWDLVICKHCSRYKDVSDAIINFGNN